MTSPPTTTRGAARRLEVDDLCVDYGGVSAVSKVSLAVGAGELVGLIGPNGAGKTSLIDGLTGFTAATGSVRLDGTELGGLRPSTRARLGLTRTFQSGELFEQLSVFENLVAAAHPNSLRRMVVDLFRPSRSVPREQVQAALDLVGLADVGEHLPDELSPGQTKLAALARALVGGPACALLDEPAAGLDPVESARLGRTLRAVVDDGCSLLLVDHDMGLVFSVCDWIYVIDFGELIAEGRPEDLRADPRVVAAYLGTPAS